HRHVPALGTQLEYDLSENVLPVWALASAYTKTRPTSSSFSASSRARLPQWYRPVWSRWGWRRCQRIPDGCLCTHPRGVWLGIAGVRVGASAYRWHPGSCLPCPSLAECRLAYAPSL